MKIRINETQYTTLTESVGVPTNIVNVARLIYEDIMSKLKPLIDVEDFLDDEILLKGDFSINDYQFKSIQVDFNIEDIRNYNVPNGINVIVLGMTHRGTMEMIENYNYISTTDKKNIKLFINLGVSHNLTSQELINILKEDRVTIVSCLSHELMHAYDDYKNKIISIKKRVNYRVGNETAFGGVKPLNNFIQYMYYAHTTENLVRPAEIYAKLEELGITRKEFYDFLLNDSTYEIYKKGSELTYSKLREQLLQSIPEIKSTLDDNNVDYPEDISDKDLVDFTLEMCYQHIINWKKGIMSDLLTQNPLEGLFGFNGKKAEYFNKYIKKINRFGNNYEKFYIYETNQITHICKKMMKKLSKLYSLIDEKTPN